ncbi:MAG TPA: hypothetical protein PLX79_00595 [Candidatus Dojkabacteria bacterium]|nr:hypothetical protein [Candidatus Dojkabacteria bacterium]
MSPINRNFLDDSPFIVISSGEVFCPSLNEHELSENVIVGPVCLLILLQEMSDCGRVFDISIRMFVSDFNDYVKFDSRKNSIGNYILGFMASLQVNISGNPTKTSSIPIECIIQSFPAYYDLNPCLSNFDEGSFPDLKGAQGYVLRVSDLSRLANLVMTSEFGEETEVIGEISDEILLRIASSIFTLLEKYEIDDLEKDGIVEFIKQHRNMYSSIFIALVLAIRKSIENSNNRSKKCGETS